MASHSSLHLLPRSREAGAIRQQGWKPGPRGPSWPRGTWVRLGSEDCSPPDTPTTKRSGHQEPTGCTQLPLCPLTHKTGPMGPGEATQVGVGLALLGPGPATLESAHFPPHTSQPPASHLGSPPFTILSLPRAALPPPCSLGGSHGQGLLPDRGTRSLSCSNPENCSRHL